MRLENSLMAPERRTDSHTLLYGERLDLRIGGEFTDDRVLMEQRVHDTVECASQGNCRRDAPALTRFKDNIDNELGDRLFVRERRCALRIPEVIEE